MFLVQKDGQFRLPDRGLGYLNCRYSYCALTRNALVLPEKFRLYLVRNLLCLDDEKESKPQGEDEAVKAENGSQGSQSEPPSGSEVSTAASAA